MGTKVLTLKRRLTEYFSHFEELSPSNESAAPSGFYFVVRWGQAHGPNEVGESDGFVQFQKRNVVGVRCINITEKGKNDFFFTFQENSPMNILNN